MLDNNGGIVVPTTLGNDCRDDTKHSFLLQDLDRNSEYR